MDLGKPMTFSRVVIREAPWDRVRKFQLQYKDGQTWRTFHEGTVLGDFQVDFKPVTARHVRLNILQATNVATIWEVYLVAPKGVGRKRG